MPRIPLPEAGQVRARPLGVDTQRLEARPTDWSPVFRNLSAATENAAGLVRQVRADDEKARREADEAAARAKREADAIAVTDQETGYQGDITTAEQGDTRGEVGDDVPSGFLHERGRAAIEKSAGTLDWLEKRRLERAKALANDEQKQLFLKRTGGMYEDARRRVEGHVGRERRAAAESSVEARKDAALSELARRPVGDDVGRLAAGPEGPIRALALSAEDGEAKVREWRGKVAATRVSALLGEGAGRDWKAAERVLEESKADLSPKAAEQLAGDVAKVKASEDVLARARLAIESHRDEVTGFVDEERARDQARLGTPKEQFKAVMDLTDDMLGQEAEKKKAVIDDRARPVWAQLQRERTLARVDPRTQAWLQDNAPEEWKKLVHEEAWYREQRERRGREGEPAERRAQDDANDLALEDYRRRPASERLQLDVRKVFAGSKANELGLRKIEAAQTKERDADAKGLTSGENQFVTKTLARVDPFLISRYGNKREGLKQAREQAEATIRKRYSAEVLNLDHRPSPKEEDELAAAAQAAVVSEAISGKPLQTRLGEPPTKPPAAPSQPKSAGKVEVVNEDGVPGFVAAAKLDAWLAKNPKRKRK